MSIQTILQKKLAEHFPGSTNPAFRHVGGGSINESYRLEFSGQSVFCKVNSATKFPHLFSKEKNGLHLLASQGMIKTPEVIDCFEEEGYQFLLLQWIGQGERTEHFWKKFGEQLAALHVVTNSYHGFSENNYMGSVPQENTPHQNWCSFFAAERLTPMVRLCAEKKLLRYTHVAQFAKLEQKLSALFDEEPPSLLHGDLWSGNFMCNDASSPVLIDPAVYYGHRSMDLAMTTLFGGFHQAFYEAYHYHSPLPSNYEEQWAVCNLYPLLLHLYLFGTGYLPQIEKTLKQFT